MMESNFSSQLLILGTDIISFITFQKTKITALCM